MSTNLLKLPPLDAIRGFVVVARRMSITLAAQDLCLTQSAVSRQIQALEEFLGTPLFVRKFRSIALTDAGEELFRLASPWLDRLAEYSASVKDERRYRPVTITTSIGIAALWLIPRLGRFQAAYPNVDVRIAAQNRVVDLNYEGVDLAIRYSSGPGPAESATRLFIERILPVASPAVAARAFAERERIFDEVFIELEQPGMPWLSWSGWLEKNDFPDAKPRAFLHFNQYDQVIQAAVEGQGIALGRVPLIEPMLGSRKLVAYAGPTAEIADYAYWLIQASEIPRPEVALFRQWIIDEVDRDPVNLLNSTERVLG